MALEEGPAILDYPFLTPKDDLKDLGVFIFGFGFLISLVYDRGTENVKNNFFCRVS